MSTPRLLVIQHEDGCPLGLFALSFEAVGVGYDVVHGGRGDPIPADLGENAGLVVLGGESGANDDSEAPWLPATKALIASSVIAGRCFLGICLGHQLAAVALGGEIKKNPNGHATGLTPVTLTSAGKQDPLLGATTPGARAIQWNFDTVSKLPDGAKVLATAPDGTIQAARYGDRAWGVQFHPEATPTIFNGWTVDKRSAYVPPGLVLAAVAQEIADAEPELTRSWAPLAERFATVVREQLPVS